jgi:hypothetical protein
VGLWCGHVLSSRKLLKYSEKFWLNPPFSSHKCGWLPLFGKFGCDSAILFQGLIHFCFILTHGIYFVINVKPALKNDGWCTLYFNVFNISGDQKSTTLNRVYVSKRWIVFDGFTMIYYTYSRVLKLFWYNVSSVIVHSRIDNTN